MTDQKCVETMLRDLEKGNVSIEGEELIIGERGIRVQGMYVDRINGGPWQETPNIVPFEGLDYILNAALVPATSREAAWYLALHSGATAPADAWTSDSYPSTASEITSNVEGYTEGTRPAWAFEPIVSGEVSSYNTPAAYTIATAGSLVVTGAAVLSSSAKGSTSGILLSATNYATARTLSSGDNYQVGYRIKFIP